MTNFSDNDKKEILNLKVTQMKDLLSSGKISNEELVNIHIDQVEKYDTKTNAVCTFTPEQAVSEARKLDSKKKFDKPLSGIPIFIKDLTKTKGIRTTMGSRIYENDIPEEDDLVVEKIKNSGSIILGKSNTPEFGAGSQTFNEVFGATLNPYDLSKTCGGSSGGAAVAVACRMLPFADGSDLGGSLRNPANYCNVVGFRPSVGRVPSWPNESGWNSFSVDGPIAKTVEDVSLMLSVLAGPDSRSPISLSESGDIFMESLESNLKGIRIAWSPDLGGLPVDSKITKVLESKRSVFEDMGAIVEDEVPDFDDADQIFKTFRAWHFELKLGSLLPKHREKLKKTVLWNLEAGEKLSGKELGIAEINRTKLFHRLQEFMQKYDFLALPVSQVPPFPVEQEFVSEINGIKMDTYLDWMKSCYFISVTGHPAISVPCGFTVDGLPVGIQLVGRHQDDLGVLQLAHAFEKETQCHKNIPNITMMKN